MRAVVRDSQGVRVRDVGEPSPTENQVRVKVHTAGICNTDLELIRGYMDFRGTLGHEFVGTVDDGPEGWRGARVVGEINFGCGQCALCRKDLSRHCPNRSVLGIMGADGAFAEHVAIPIANLHRVPDDLANELAVFAEPLAAAFEILEQVHVDPSMSVTVLGDGKLGLMIAQVLQTTGANLRVVGKHDDNLGVLSRRGVTTHRLTEWNRAPADLVVEATGSNTGLALAMAAVHPRGTLVLKSTLASQYTIDLAPLVIDEITVVGSRCGPFDPALRALADGRVDVRPLISRQFALGDAISALDAAAAPDTIKVLLHCE